LIDSRHLNLEKDDSGQMVINQNDLQAMKSGDKVLIIEDLCSFGTGVSEAIRLIKQSSPSSVVLPRMLYIFNRGDVTHLDLGDIGTYLVDPLTSHKIKTWEPTGCDLCNNLGSEAIKPKSPTENWQALMDSQN
jgi:orotate phosphoribosyltransferase